MAAKKATTTGDLTEGAAVSPPTLEDQVAKVVELTDKAMVADVETPGYKKATSPAGAVTTVPEGIVDALKESGYSIK